MKKQVLESNLRLMVFESARALGEKVDEHLLKMYNLDKEKYTFIVPIKEDYFEDGHLKVEIDDTVRGVDLFMLTDIGNYSLEYKMHGFINHTSPNDLMMQIKDGIGTCRHARSINLVMPLLYAGRQHRRNTRENLTCGMNLHELDEIKNMKSFITFDAHDQGVEHAVHNMEFTNFYPSNTILKDLIRDLSKEELEKLVFIAPDNGATGRRNIYLNSCNSKYVYREAGSFVKQRDYNHVVEGKNPVISHDYSGNGHIEGYTAIVSDDMISSGGSMFEVIDELKKLKVKHIYIIVTYVLFTRGIAKFDEYYKKGMFDGIYTTNLSYIPDEYKKVEWLHICDCSKFMSEAIYNIHNDISLIPLLRDKSYPAKLIDEKFEN